MKYKTLVKILVVFCLLFTAVPFHSEQYYVNDDGKLVWGHPDDSSSPGGTENDDNDDEETTSEEDEPVDKETILESNANMAAVVINRVKKANDEQTVFADATGVIDEAQNGAAAAENEKNLKLEQAKQNEKDNIVLIKEKTDSEKEEEEGDPVKISSGTYEQNETDFYSANTIEVSITRRYSSGNDIVSGYGRGWMTNLDQRIILGTQADSEEITAALEQYADELSVKIAILEQNIRSVYGVYIIEIIPQLIAIKMQSNSENLTKAQNVYETLCYLEEEAQGYKALNKIIIIKERAWNLYNDILSKKNALEQSERAYRRAVSVLNELKIRHQMALEELEKSKTLLEVTRQRRQRNNLVMFDGMKKSFEETGLDAICVIDENGYPHVMKETSSSSGVWKTPDASRYSQCVRSGNQLVLYENDGTKRVFDEKGFLISIEDRNANTIQIIRNGDEKISSVKSSDGESISVVYEGSFIKKIINDRTGKECASYSYSSGQLKAVTDSEGDTVAMEYDSNGRMIKLNKCDQSFISFEYGLVTSDGRALATATSNEEGFTEQFDYNGNTTIYTDHDGNKTVYVHDSNHKVVLKTESDGSVTEYGYDSNGNVTVLTQNGNQTFYEYDGLNRTKAFYSDGSCELWTYNSFSQVTSYTDRDGVFYEYVRDGKGNLIRYMTGGKTVFTQEFNSKGQVTVRTEYSQNPVVTRYSYDSHGNLSKQECGTSATSYEYDSQNRITAITLGDSFTTEYEYDGRNVIKKDYNGLETTYITNGRKDLTKVIQKDTKTDILHITRIEYDRRHLPLKVFSGDGKIEKLIAQYSYTKEGKLLLQTSTGEESWTTLYEYKNGIISGITRGTGDRQSYSYTILPGNKKLLTVTDAAGNETLFEYDSYGNLITYADGNGTKQEFTYTKAGMLSGGQSSFGGWYKYAYSDSRLTAYGEEGSASVKTEYYPDGSIKQVTDCYGITTDYYYDSCGRVISTQSACQKLWYEYDELGRITRQITGDQPDESSAVYHVTCEYSKDGRSVTLTEGAKYKTVYELDAFGNVIKQTDGNGNSKLYEYDSQNQMTASFDGYLNRTEYEYNALGKISRVVLPDGAVTEYQYNSHGQLIKVTDDCGTFYEAAYDSAGRMKRERTRADSEKAYEYDSGGRITKILCGGHLVEAYSYSSDNRIVTVKDGNGNDYYYSYDVFGRLVGERNRNNLEQRYLYDQAGSLKSQSDFAGRTSSINYSSDRTVKSVSFADGSENSFVYDAAGNIIQGQNEYGKTLYRYDTGGRLIYQNDVTTGEEVYFEYDSAGNRTRVYSTNRETFYTYGKNNEVTQVSDNKQRIRINLEYDSNGRETCRSFANGIKVYTEYDKAGRVILITQKSSSGQLLWAEGYVYGNDGKRIASVDNSACVTLYEYNQKGELCCVYYPYSSELVIELKQQAQENGLPVINDIAVNRYISAQERTALAPLLDKMQYGLSFKLSNLQIFIEEKYEYDKNANRISKTNSFGKIEYTYDCENRLIFSGANGKTIVKYTYDNNSNLVAEESELKKSSYVYNSQNRLIFCEVTDKASKTYANTRYAYDAFGRRIIVQDNNQAALRTLYDGFTFDVIKQSPTFASGLFTDSTETGIRWDKTGHPTGDRYRFIDDASSQPTSRYQNERTPFTVNGKITAQASSEGTRYFTTDILGSVRTASDAGGSQKNQISYDAFGSLIQGTLSGSSDFGYTGKQKDPTSNLYNYGFRDYNPANACFNTIDPIRDGTNWFSYCNGDPVNFVDLWGLCMGKDKKIMVIGYNMGEPDPSKSKDAYILIKNTAEIENLIGKEYTNDNDHPYVCTTFVQEVLEKSGYNSSEFLPGGQRVIDSVNILDDKLITPESGKNPEEGTYVFYHIDDDNVSGHTGIIHFDSKGNATILHNGSDGNNGSNVNERTRSSLQGSFDTWFPENNNPVKYKRIGE